LGKYEEAELIAARCSASKMGFYEQQAPDDYTGEETDAEGNLMTEAEPGVIERLSPGVSFKSWDPSHPNGNYDGFRRGMLRGVAAGIGLSFPTLSKDSSDINFSTLRSLLLNERDAWMMLQGWFIRKQRRRLFSAWLESAMLAGKIRLPFAQLAKFNAPVWIGRRWKWVDPMKDVNAALLEINNGLSSRRAKIAEGGGDIDEVFDDLANDMDLAAAYNLDFGNPKDGLVPADESFDDEEEEEDEGAAPDDKAA
jgi:lambda family phage portal protein